MYSRILVPIDGSPTSQRGLRQAIALARLAHAELELLHVIDAYPVLPDMAMLSDLQPLREEMARRGNKLLETAAHEAQAAGVRARVRLREVDHGRIAGCVEATAREYDCDLIVMGTHGRRGFNRFVMGSDAEQVLRSSRVPVMLVPGREDES